jgi:hypothetical protein
MGTKIYINFSKYSFEECINRLKDEVNSAIGSAIQTKKSINQTRSVNTNSVPNPEKIKNDIDKWTVSDVNNWIGSNEIDSLLKSILNGFDGKMLKHLHSIKKLAPEYFFSSISQNRSISLKSCVEFSMKLDELLE